MIDTITQILAVLWALRWLLLVALLVITTVAWLEASTHLADTRRDLFRVELENERLRDRLRQPRGRRPIVRGPEVQR